jgi:hypothetical protein
MHPAALAKIAVIAVHLPNPPSPTFSLHFAPSRSRRLSLSHLLFRLPRALPPLDPRPASHKSSGGGPPRLPPSVQPRSARRRASSRRSLVLLLRRFGWYASHPDPNLLSPSPRLACSVCLIPTHHGYICLGASFSSSVRSTPQRLPSPARGAAAHQARRRSFPRFVLPTRCCCCWLYPRHYHGSITYCRPVVTCPYHRMMPLLSCFLASRIFLMSSRHTFIADTVERTARSRSIHSCSLFALCFFFLPPLLYLLDSSYLSPSARWAITADSPMIACFSWIAELMRR